MLPRRVKSRKPRAEQISEPVHTAEEAAAAAAALMAEEEQANAAAQQAKQQQASKKARQKQRKQVRWHARPELLRACGLKAMCWLCMPATGCYATGSTGCFAQHAQQPCLHQWSAPYAPTHTASSGSHDAVWHLQL